MRTRELAGAVLAGALLLAGCSGDVAPGDDDAAPTPDALASPLPKEDWAGFWDDYDRRVNRAREVSLGPPYRASAWQRVSTGPALAINEFAIALREAAGMPGDEPDLETTPLQVYSGSFDSYPMWVLAAGTVTRVGEPATEEEEHRAALRLFTKEATDASWLGAASVDLNTEMLPVPFEGDATADQTQVERADRIADELELLWEDGRTPASVTVSAELRELVDSLDVPTESVRRSSLEVDRWPDTSTRAVRVAGNTLALVVFRARVTLHPYPGRVLYWTGDRAKLYGGGKQDVLRTDHAVTVLLRVPDDDGVAFLAGLETAEVLFEGAPNA